MKNSYVRLILICFILSVILLGDNTAAFAGPVIIDHTCTDLSQIPDEWINEAQENIKTYYAHRSHGWQITIGLGEIDDVSNEKYRVTIGDETLPVQAGSLCIYDRNDVYPSDYWSSAGAIQDTQNILDTNPTINVSIWTWCIELDTLGEDDVREYLEVMADFESAYPDVSFIYMTGNAQSTGSAGYNRYLRNEQIRDWVRNSNHRVLYDFADLDSWRFNPDTGHWEHATYEYNGVDVPVEHPQFNDISGPGHTTLESCEQKGKAAWWMMAKLAGWNNTAEDDDVSPEQIPREEGRDITLEQILSEDDSKGGICFFDSAGKDWSPSMLFIILLVISIFFLPEAIKQIILVYKKD